MNILRKATTVCFAFAAAIVLSACSSTPKPSKSVAPEGEFFMAGAVPGVKANVGELAMTTSRSAGENGLARAVASCAADDGDGYTVSLFHGTQCIFRDIPARYVMNGKFAGAKIETGDLLWWNRIERVTTTIKPEDEVGEFYLMGQVGRAGVYSLSSPITIKHAVLGADAGVYLVSMPRSVELIRRIGADEEITQRYPLDEIVRGDIVDVQIFANDIVNVGMDVMTDFLGHRNYKNPSPEMKRRALSASMHFGQMCLPQYETELAQLEAQRAALRKIAASDVANPRAIAAAKSVTEYFDHQIEKITAARDALKTQIRQNKIEIEKLAILR